MPSATPDNTYRPFGKTAIKEAVLKRIKSMAQ